MRARTRVARIASGVCGRVALDVGIGTGVAARPFRDAGFRVLGVEVDARMAAFARSDGFEVELARFEEWDPAGRMFDLVIAGTTWHWIEPAAGANVAARILRADGRLAVFWNVARLPPDLAAAFAAVYRRVVPEMAFLSMPADPLAGYQPILAATTDAIRAADAFAEPQRYEIEWERTYAVDQWQAQVPTFGGHGQLSAAQLIALLDGIGAAIGDAGSHFTARYTALAITADRLAA
jgi:SAM-dependent methyltransferase